MYLQLTDTPLGFPILDDLRLALLAQRRQNEWRASVCEAVCAFIDQKMARRKVGITATAQNIQFFRTDRFGKTTICYCGGTFDIAIEVDKTNSGLVLEVIGVSHTNPFQIGFVAIVGERAVYGEIQNGE